MDNNPYSSNQTIIEAVLRAVCRREGLWGDRADEFSQWTRLKLIESDYAILRSFKHQSSFKTFLVAVIRNKCSDWRDLGNDGGSGKFHASADAKKLGPIAVNLERLVLRDNMTYDEAAQLLVSKGIAPSIKACDDIWGQLKRAPRRLFVSDADLEIPLPRPSVDPVEDQERQRLTRKVHASFRAALHELPPGDQLLFKLRYWDGVSVARIAQLQQIEQKPLYRRYEQLQKQLERDMHERGITDAEIRDFFEGLDIDPDDFEDEDGK